MKRSIIILILLLTQIFAEDKYTSMYFEFEFKGKTDVFIDCQYNNKQEYKFVNDVALNKLFGLYCENKEEYKIVSIEDFRRDYIKLSNKRSEIDIYPSKMFLESIKNETFDLEEFNKYVRNIHVVIKSFNHSNNVFTVNQIPVYFIENFTLTIEEKLNNLPLRKNIVKDYQIKEFEFNKDKKEPLSVTLNEEFSLTPTLYTNDYVIAEKKECVNGYVYKNRIHMSETCPLKVKVVEKPIEIKEVIKEEIKKIGKFISPKKEEVKKQEKNTNKEKQKTEIKKEVKTEIKKEVITNP